MNMSKRLTLEDKLAAIRGIREELACAEHIAALRASLSDKSNLVVAAAAAIVGERGHVELATELEAAFHRFLVHPAKDDKLCRAKVAVIQALERLEHARPEVFRNAARHVQLEPVWGGQADSAASLRAAALIALGRIGADEDLALLVDSLADPEKEVRIAAAQALTCFEAQTASLLLRLKLRLGDGDPEVLSECFSSLLVIDPRAYLPFVCNFLRPENQAYCEAAVLALGKSRLPEALQELTSCWQRVISTGLREQVLLAISMLRLPAAIDYLLKVVAAESEKDAIAALFALKIHNYDARLQQRIAEILLQKRSPALQARFERDFSGLEPS
jgi:HEAT repeat protein